jgi:hypothetical protein
MRFFDPRLTPARADLAAKKLEGKVAAARYVEGHSFEVIEPQAPLRGEPAPDAPLATEALKGERVTIYDSNAEGWAWGQLAADGYVQCAGAGRGGADAQGRGAADVCFSGSIDQVAAGRSTAARRASCYRPFR